MVKDGNSNHPIYLKPSNFTLQIGGFGISLYSLIKLSNNGVIYFTFSLHSITNHSPSSPSKLPKLYHGLNTRASIYPPFLFILFFMPSPSLTHPLLSFRFIGCLIAGSRGLVICLNVIFFGRPS